MTYSPELIRQMTGGQLENGSEAEVEIRGCSIAAVERIVARTKVMMKEETLDFPFVNSALVDYFLWGFRREIAEEMEQFPYHKTRSIFYWEANIFFSRENNRCRWMWFQGQESILLFVLFLIFFFPFL